MLTKQQIKDYPDVLDINQMCDMIGVSLTTGYKLIHSDKVRSKKVGRAYKILKKNVIRYLDAEL